MKCTIKRDRLMGYLLQMLNPGEKAHVEAHLKGCLTCRNELGKLKKVKQLLRQWNVEGPPAGLKKNVLNMTAPEHVSEQKNISASRDRSHAAQDLFEVFRKLVGSEQLRIYKCLIDFLGKEKGEEAFDYYLTEQINMTLSAPTGKSLSYADAVSKSLGGQVRTTRHGKRLKKETVEKCPYIALAEEIGLHDNPCMTICLRQMKVIEKQKTVKIDRIKTKTSEAGGCIFLSKRIGTKR